MGAKILKICAMTMISAFIIIAFFNLSYALRPVTDDSKGNIEESIKKEEVQKREIIQKVKTQRSNMATPPATASENAAQMTTRVPTQEKGTKTSASFYKWGGLFFVIVIGGAAVILFRKLGA
ncbi:MAG: hypothetical protein V1653_00865 [bacterium]